MIDHSIQCSEKLSCMKIILPLLPTSTWWNVKQYCLAEIVVSLSHVLKDWTWPNHSTITLGLVTIKLKVDLANMINHSMKLSIMVLLVKRWAKLSSVVLEWKALREVWINGFHDQNNYSYDCVLSIMLCSVYYVVFCLLCCVYYYYLHQYDKE